MLPRLTDKTFFAAIKSSRPIMVTFTAPKRCPHCREQKPALEWLASEGYPVYLVDVEEPDTAWVEAQLGGRGVPFIKMYANGQLLSENLGMMDGDELRAFFRAGADLASQMRPLQPHAPPPSTVAAATRDAPMCPPGMRWVEDTCMRDGSIRGIVGGFGRGKR